MYSLLQHNNLWTALLLPHLVGEEVWTALPWRISTWPGASEQRRCSSWVSNSVGRSAGAGAGASLLLSRNDHQQDLKSSVQGVWGHRGEQDNSVQRNCMDGSVYRMYLYGYLCSICNVLYYTMLYYVILCCIYIIYVCIYFYFIIICLYRYLQYVVYICYIFIWVFVYYVFIWISVWQYLVIFCYQLKKKSFFLLLPPPFLNFVRCFVTFGGFFCMYNSYIFCTCLT